MCSNICFLSLVVVRQYAHLNSFSWFLMHCTLQSLICELYQCVLSWHWHCLLCRDTSHTQESVTPYGRTANGSLIWDFLLWNSCIYHICAPSSSGGHSSYVSQEGNGERTKSHIGNTGTFQFYHHGLTSDTSDFPLCQPQISTWHTLISMSPHECTVHGSEI